jgi:hypothetical protein
VTVGSALMQKGLELLIRTAGRHFDARSLPGRAHALERLVTPVTSVM